MDVITKLKPCPFCGKQPQEHYEYGSQLHGIRCVDGGKNTKHVLISSYGNTPEEAAISWNTRFEITSTKPVSGEPVSLMECALAYENATRFSPINMEIFKDGLEFHPWQYNKSIAYAKAVLDAAEVKYVD